MIFNIVKKFDHIDLYLNSNKEVMIKKEYLINTHDPFVKCHDGSIIWHINGKIHRKNGPAKEYYDKYGFGRKDWYINGKLHREDGPAIEYANGGKSWYLNGKRHRENGPAIEYDDEDREWWVNGKRHREDGPAIARNDASQFPNQWWYHGNRIFCSTQKEFEKLIKLQAFW